jgi:hypothetical protein
MTGAGVQPRAEAREVRAQTIKDVAMTTLQARADAYRRLGNDLEEMVRACRRVGCTWAEVGHLLGVSAQAAHRKYSTLDGMT